MYLQGDCVPTFSHVANGMTASRRAQGNPFPLTSMTPLRLIIQYTSKLSSVEGGRRSFPSGHSSTAFAGMTFFALYLASQSAGYTSSKLSRIFIILLPLFFATWVAISRVEDYVSVATSRVSHPKGF